MNSPGFEIGMKKIAVMPPPPSIKKTCPDPIAATTATQLTNLDPTSQRTRLFSPSNPDRARVGDILLVRLKSGDPFSGVVLNIRQSHSVIDTAILLRNQLTRVGVEMWFKIYSPNVDGIEVVQRKARRARRAKLYYMRQARHDVGSVEGVVRTYLRGKTGVVAGARGSGSGQGQRKKSKAGNKRK
jgi:large subunit ribosomal protein L19